jgi:hypothetical protein
MEFPQEDAPSAKMRQDAPSRASSFGQNGLKQNVKLVLF